MGSEKMLTPEHYREQAAKLRAMASQCDVASLQQELLDLARQYDVLAERAGSKRI
jgi:hypothetical protein